MSRQSSCKDKNEEHLYQMMRRKAEENYFHWENESKRMQRDLIELGDLYRRTGDQRYASLIESYSMGFQALNHARYSFLDLKREVIREIINIQNGVEQKPPFILPK